MAEKKPPKSSTKKQSVSEDGEQPSFENALAELQALVDAMEKGDISLEQSLQAFERGVELTRFCQSALFQAEQKVQQLNADGQIQDLSVPALDGDDSDAR